MDFLKEDCRKYPWDPFIFFHLKYKNSTLFFFDGDLLQKVAWKKLIFKFPENKPQVKENFITYDLEKSIRYEMKSFWISNTYNINEAQREIHQQLPEELIQKMKQNKHLITIKIEPYTKIKLGYRLKKASFSDELLKYHSS